MPWRPGKDYCLKWMDRLNVRPYPLSWVYLESIDLLYIPIPKNASTQILESLYEVEHGVTFQGSRDDDKWAGNVHFYYTDRFPPKTAPELLELGAGKIATVIRDPIQRLVSAYRNRLIEIRSLEQRRWRCRLLGLKTQPQLNEVLNHLGQYQFASPQFRQHSEPQSLYLRHLWPHLTHVYAIEMLHQFHRELFADKPSRTRKTINRSGGSTSGESIPHTVLQKVVQHYAEDYRLLQRYYSPPGSNNVRDVKTGVSG